MSNQHYGSDCAAREAGETRNVGNPSTLFKNAEQSALAMQSVLDHKEGSAEQGNHPPADAPAEKNVVMGGPCVLPSQGAPPGQGGSMCQNCPLCPTDYSDVGQATVLAREYGGELRYAESTDWLSYNGSFWEELPAKAQSMAQELTSRQLKEAEAELDRCEQVLVATGVRQAIEFYGLKKAKSGFGVAEKLAYEEFERAEAYKQYVIKSRDSRCIAAALREARPMLYINPDKLDADAFLMNTPNGTVDLRTGLVHPHCAEEYHTKQTAVGLSNVGANIWQDALNTFFCGDADLIRHAQEIVGLSAIGAVFQEMLVIAYGDGRNGKTTFWNTIARVLGTYSGNLSADILTVSRGNPQPEMAELKGKRLVVAAELDEGTRLSTGNLKTLCSTGEIYAAKKYRQPVAFKPTHTVTLQTNHLPRVGAVDDGTWRRIQILPFNAKIEGTGEIKSYETYLFDNAAGAILQWVVDGAMRVIANGYKLTPPQVVLGAIQQYRVDNDQISHFLEECCNLDPAYEDKSGRVYTVYRSYCLGLGEYCRNQQDFNTVLETYGYTRHRKSQGVMIQGLHLKREYQYIT